MQTLELAHDVYQRLLDIVVADGVFSETERSKNGRLLSDEEKKKIDQHKKIDARIPYLMRVSGKGGWTKAVEEFEGTLGRPGRKSFVNVSLLEHILSVTRGALVIAELDLRKICVDNEELETRLARIAAVAFLHDADKMLDQDRSVDLTPEDIDTLVKRYSVDKFLDSYALSIPSDLLVGLIDAVEVSRAAQFVPGRPLVPQALAKDCLYIRLADRLDGAFLNTNKNMTNVLEEMQHANLRTDILKDGWSVFHLRSPHTPFLLDELQTTLSSACVVHCGHPPLIEVHHDGELTVVVPSSAEEQIRVTALDRLAGIFGGKMRVGSNMRGARKISDMRGGIDDLLEAVDACDEKTFRDLGRVAKATVIEHEGALAELFSPFAIAPSWPDLDKPGALVSAFGAKIDPALSSSWKKAGALATALAFKPDSKHPLTVERREAKLTTMLLDEGVEVPDWLLHLDDPVGRPTLLAIVAVAAADQNPQLEQNLFGVGGLIDLWLLGEDANNPGLCSQLTDAGSYLGSAVRDYFDAILSRDVVFASDESANGRCHFTNMPVGPNAIVSTETGLHALKVTAFSGREGRPESFSKTEQDTRASPIAQAEHRLRSMRSSRGGEGLSIFISSPSTSGLFSTLLLSKSGNLQGVDLGFFDILREDLTDAAKITVTSVDPLLRRYLIGRFEQRPTCFASDTASKNGHVDFALRVFKASLRMGRPVHVFRGLPYREAGYVAFDCLPESLERFLGGRSFRIEQIDSCINKLEMLLAIATTNYLGDELAHEITDSESEFGAYCLILKILQGRDPKDVNRRLLISIYRNLEDIYMTNDQDQGLIAFADAMTRVQRVPIQSDGHNVSELGLRLAIEAVETAGTIGQISHESLVAAVAGEISETLRRRGLFASHAYRPDETLDEAIDNAARIFVNDVWVHGFNKRAPSSKRRRIAYAIYSYAFSRRRTPTTQTSSTSSASDLLSVA